MATRVQTKQSEHDAALYAARTIYQHYHKQVWINPNGEKNKSWSGRYVDVIAIELLDADRAWVIEIETESSVSDAEARTHWKDNDAAYEHWYVAVPVESDHEAKTLLQKYGIKHCTVVTWTRKSDGGHTFWGLPGV